MARLRNALGLPLPSGLQLEIVASAGRAVPEQDARPYVFRQEIGAASTQYRVARAGDDEVELRV